MTSTTSCLFSIAFRRNILTCKRRYLSLSTRLQKRTTSQPVLGHADIAPEDSKDSNRKYIYGPSSETDFKPTRHPLNAVEQMTIGDYHTQNMDDPRFARTTVDILQDDNERVVIHSYNNIGFQLSDGRFLAGPICIFPRLALSWMVLAPEDINEDCIQLLNILAPKPDVVVVGCGGPENVEGVRHRLAPFFQKLKIGYEILPVDQAAFTFNFLVSENRLVVGLLFPMIDIPADSALSEEETSRRFREYANSPVDSFEWVRHFADLPMAFGKAFGLIEEIKEPEKPKLPLPQKIERRKRQPMIESNPKHKQIENSLTQDKLTGDRS